MLATACGQTGPTAGPTAGAQGQQGQPAGATDPKSITANIRIGTWESGNSLDIWKQVIDGFNKEYPNIKVSLEAVPDNYGTKILTQIAAGDAPDVFQIGDGDARMFVERGGTTNLNDYFKGKNNLPGLDPSIFYPNIYQTGVVDNTPHFLTKDYSPLVVYYNKDLFDKAGVPYPKDGWTWEEFRDTAKKLTKVGSDGRVETYGVNLPGTWIRAIEPFVFSNGGDLMNQDGTKVEGFLNSQKTIEAFQFYVDLYTKDKVSPSPTDVSTTFKGVDLFQTGRVAMNWTGRWPMADYTKNPNLKWGVVGLPKKEKPANAICWAGFALYQKSKNPDAAWLFLRYIGGEPGQKLFAQHALPSVKSVADTQQLNENQKVVLDQVQYLQPLPDMRSRWYNDSVAKYLGESLERMLSKGGDVKPELDQAAQKAQAELDKLRAQNK